MKLHDALSNRTTRRIPAIACAVALTAAFTVGVPIAARAAQVTPPSVPGNIAVPAGSKAFLVGHAVGTQNYVCLPATPSDSDVAYVLFSPEATLFGDDAKEVVTHYFSPNPFEVNANPALVAHGPIRATWKHSRDTSTVWGLVKPGNASSDPTFVRPGAIAWLLLTVVGADDVGGGDKLAKATFIQRLNTAGGVAPATGCASPADVGNQAFVPYTADYFFFKGP